MYTEFIQQDEKLGRYDQSTIYLRMYLTELLFCDRRKFKQLNMALMIQQRNKKETNYIDTLLIETL